MSHRSEDQLTTSGTREAQTRRSWWQRAKDFVITIFTNRYNATGDHAKIQPPNRKVNTNTQAVLVEEHAAPGRVHVDQGDAQGVSIDIRLGPKATSADGKNGLYIAVSQRQVPGPKGNTTYMNADNSSVSRKLSSIIFTLSWVVYVSFADGGRDSIYPAIHGSNILFGHAEACGRLPRLHANAIQRSSRGLYEARHQSGRRWRYNREWRFRLYVQYLPIR